MLDDVITHELIAKKNTTKCLFHGVSRNSFLFFFVVFFGKKYNTNKHLQKQKLLLGAF